MPQLDAGLRRSRTAAVLVIAAAVCLTSCNRPVPRQTQTRPPAPVFQPPQPGVRAQPAVPIVRVLLAGGPLQRCNVATTGGYFIQLDGKTVFSSAMALTAQIGLQQGSWTINQMQTGSGTMDIVSSGGMVQYEGTTYRGWLRLLRVDGGFMVLNHVDLEDYLAGVLARELYPAWPIASYEALAVAARTYAIYQAKTIGRTRGYDLGADQGSQVYGGFAAETAKSRQAVADTFSLVLTCHQDGKDQIFKTQYSSACGGVTNPAAVLRDAPLVEPLSGGQACSDCTGCRFYRWDTVRVPKSDVYAAIKRMFPAAEQLRGISWVQVESATPSGRPIWLVVHGLTGAGLRMRAEDMRLAMLRSGNASLPRLPSMNCRIETSGDCLEFSQGKGFGHGVGLCQWGSQAKANAGWTYRQILAYYYPSSKVIQGY